MSRKHREMSAARKAYLLRVIKRHATSNTPGPAPLTSNPARVSAGRHEFAPGCYHS
jgi:hypothetical protein